MENSNHKNALIIGSGLAGLSCAIELAKQGVQVTVITKTSDPVQSNTSWAQGGIAYIEADNANGDSAELFAKDIIKSGHGLCFEPAVKQLTSIGNELIRKQMIEDLGITFDRSEDGCLSKGQEGAHSKSRIVHVGDGTGNAVHKKYFEFASSHKNIEILAGHTLIDLLTTQHNCDGLNFRYNLENECLGAFVLDSVKEKVKKITADFTILATGGVGQLFLHSTNNAGAIGDGLVVAKRAGADILFPHYVQFHPTALYKGKRRFLISEVVRGAGAKLVNAAGEQFMKKYQPELLELAPRDQVTRAIIQEMLQNNDDCVYLDLANHYSGQEPIDQRFPNIFQCCQDQGIDIRKDLIPVVPAAHFLCGGIKVDLDGRTTLPRLYAIGEVSCTGVHGANRLASTALLECVTWGFMAAQSIANRLDVKETVKEDALAAIKEWEAAGPSIDLDRQRIAGDWSRIRTVMWNYVGILRSPRLLNIAAKDLRLWGDSLAELYANAHMSQDLIDLFHGIQACQIIVESARKDPVSQGCHYITD
jgi:L-aspartate oxidase